MPSGYGGAGPDEQPHQDRAAVATFTVSCAKPTSGEVLPFARVDALTPSTAAFYGRTTRDDRISWATSSFHDAVGCCISLVLRCSTDVLSGPQDGPGRAFERLARTLQTKSGLFACMFSYFAHSGLMSCVGWTHNGPYWLRAMTRPNVSI